MSNTAHLATFNAQIDTAQSVFGGSSLLLDGTGDYLSLDAITRHEHVKVTISRWITADLTGDGFRNLKCAGIGICAVLDKEFPGITVAEIQAAVADIRAWKHAELERLEEVENYSSKAHSFLARD